MSHAVEEDAELVATQARNHVEFADLPAQPRGDGVQHLVADRVAVRVIDLLEPIQVDEQRRHRTACRRQAGQRLADGFGEERTVRYLRERVVERAALQLVLFRRHRANGARQLTCLERNTDLTGDRDQETLFL